MSETERPERSPWGLVVVLASLAFLVGGILMPGIAETLLRILLAGLALGWVGARALRSDLPATMGPDTYSPFDGDLDDLAHPAVPDVVWRRARALTAADDPDGGASRPIPWPVALSLIYEAERRLEKGHGLKLDRPGDAARIRAVVSDVTCAFLGVGDPASTRDAGEAEHRMIPLTRLSDILDDLERL